MSPLRWLACLVVGAATLVLADSGTRSLAEVPEPPPAGPEGRPPAGPERTAYELSVRQAEERTRQALARPVSVGFRDTPLHTAIAFLRESCRIPILLDSRALDKIGTRTDAPVSLEVSEISLRSVLRLMLRELDLTYVIRHRALTVTTPEEAERYLTTRVYPVRDIVARQVRPGVTTYDLDALAQGILSTVAPETWKHVGGLGSISVVDSGNVKALVITQTDDGHDQIAAILGALRSLAQQAVEGNGIEPVFMEGDRPVGPAGEAISKALKQKISFQFIETLLDDVVRSLCQAAHLNVVLHRKALAEVGIPVDTPMTIHVADVTVESALRLLLNPLDLTYVVEHEVVVITTPEEAEFPYPVVFYPVADLVAREPDSLPLISGANGLTELITSTIRWETWEVVGGAGSACLCQLGNIDALVVGHSREVHIEIAHLLALLRKIARQAAEGNPVEAVMLGAGPAEKRIAEQLKAPTVLEFTDCSLHDVIDALEDRHGIQVRIDDPALEVAGIESDRRVTKHLRGISLRAALELLLEPLDLTWVIGDGTLLITTPVESQWLCTVGFYPVVDLVVCRDQNGELWDDYDSLIEVIASGLPSSLWDEWGPWIRPATFGEARVLVVDGPREVHDRISQLLKKLRRVAAASGDGIPPRRNRPQPLHAPGRIGDGSF